MQHSDRIGSLVEFSYVSRAVPGLPPAEMPRLARQAWSFNTRMGITGEMRLVDGRFFQTIEGPCEIVLALSSRIMTDRRHEGIVVTRLDPIPARRYRDWSAAGLVAHETVARPDFARAGKPRAIPAVAALRCESGPVRRGAVGAI